MRKNYKFNHNEVEIDINPTSFGPSDPQNTARMAREHRRFCFSLFAGCAEKWLREFANKNESAARLAHLQSLYFDVRTVLDGSAQGVQVSFGSRPFEFLDAHSVSSEDGGTLLFTMSPDGYVGIYFYPSKTDFRSLNEQILFYCLKINPQRLTSIEFFNSVMRDFIRYCEVSSVSIDPTMFAKNRISWIRFSRATHTDGVFRQSRLRGALAEALKWVFVVGFSGALLAIVQKFLS